MKKLSILIVFLVGFTFIHAQEEETSFGFDQGDVFIEGNIGFNSTNNKNTDTKTNLFVFNPKAGYFVSEDFAVGLQLSVASDKTEVGNSEETENIFGVGAFGRYYFLELGQRFKTYGEFGLGFASYKDEYGSVESKATGFGAELGLGMNYFVTENVAIGFSLSDILSYTSYKPDGGEAISEFNGNINVFNNFFTSAQFGLTYKF